MDMSLPLGQCEEMVEPFRRENTVYRAGESLGERVYRVIQRQAEGRAAQPGDIYDIN